MIETEMFGAIPRVKIEKFSSAPPENMLIKPKSPPSLVSNMLRSSKTSIPGVET
jgi:hypothetical protein